MKHVLILIALLLPIVANAATITVEVKDEVAIEAAKQFTDVDVLTAEEASIILKDFLEETVEEYAVAEVKEQKQAVLSQEVNTIKEGWRNKIIEDVVVEGP